VSPDETAVCVIASLALPRFVMANSQFDHAAFGDAVRVVARNLDRVIDLNLYPTECAKRSAWRHRAIGIGVQGMADVFAMMRVTPTSDKALAVYREVHETLYFNALAASANLAREAAEHMERVENALDALCTDTTTIRGAVAQVMDRCKRAGGDDADDADVPDEGRVRPVRDDPSERNRALVDAMPRMPVDEWVASVRRDTRATLRELDDATLRLAATASTLEQLRGNIPGET
jgi:ribonucleotide reductase alpha subunit